ncbi:unnamed protein product [Protopolystoma xenopodis]|uniref:Talin central domain-containing protein n=1 Tax=Protopolystoma xenopodis TaxID=117903 RepID=A0A3S5FDD8_9PLAT|nr:unnamed protein product [Protopolystoma xenopodis]
MGANQAKVTDEMGAMNAAVAQALRSANRAEAASGQDGLGLGYTGGISNSGDASDDLIMMQHSFRIVNVHFPSFVDDVKRVAVLRREAGAIQADATTAAAIVSTDETSKKVDEEVDTEATMIREKAEASTQNLLSAARHVADTFTELLNSAKPLATGLVSHFH